MSTEPARQPLSPQEEHAWRALIRLMVVLPRAIDDDLLRRSGLSLTRYVVLMRLSEVTGHALRMTELADAVSISPSRMTRIVQSMVDEGLLTRRPAPEDARASLAVLTDRGFERLREAWPSHLAGVRTLVLDHVEPSDLPVLQRITDHLLRAIEATAGAQASPPVRPARGDGS